jgi:hypothetical protein
MTKQISARASAIDERPVSHARVARTGAVLVLLSGLGLCAGCQKSTPAPTGGTPTATSGTTQAAEGGAATEAMPRRPKRPKVDPYADVYDPLQLLAAWKERLVEDKYYLQEKDNVFQLDQLVFRYTWTFNDDGAVLTVEERRGPNGEVITDGRGIIYLFVEEVEIDWGAAPEFIRNKDGEAGDKAVKSLKQKFIDTAVAKAKEDTEVVDRSVGFETDDPAARQSAAYRVLVGSGTEIEGETITGKLTGCR